MRPGPGRVDIGRAENVLTRKPGRHQAILGAALDVEDPQPAFSVAARALGAEQAERYSTGQKGNSFHRNTLGNRIRFFC